MGLMLSFFLTIIGFSVCHAEVDIETTRPLEIPVDNVTPKITSEDVAKVIPTDPTVRNSSTSTMMTRIADRTINYWYNSTAVKDSAFGHFAQQTQEKLKADVVVPAHSSEGTSHKFSFKIEAFQALAKMEYTGWMNAAINYDAKTSLTDFQIKEKLFSNKELLLSHKASKDQDLSMIALAWPW
ncbi:MAG TPA: hypothetical protein VN132_09235 [Bdellovibrio sp.]|nr:hypothetical protein [Bdellovibrio sp.]